jgi:hypothetical protein
MALESIRGGYRGAAQCTQASSQIAMGSNYPSKIVLANRQTRPGIAALRFRTSHYFSGLRESFEAELAMT